MQNLEYFKVKVGSGLQQVEAGIILCGTDVSISFGGGNAYHIGAVALASPRASHLDPEKCSASASVLCIFGHLEDELCRQAALQISAALNTVVNVTLGLHIDHASQEEIQALTDNFQKAVNESIVILRNAMEKAGVLQKELIHSYRASGPVGPKL